VRSESLPAFEGITLFIHIFGFRWKPQATDGDQARATREILSFGGRIPGLIDVSVGENLSLRDQGYTFAGLMRFTDRAAYDAYATDPTHLALLEWLIPLIEPVEFDFEA
jgi:hypothetical protein